MYPKYLKSWIKTNKDNLRKVFQVDYQLLLERLAEAKPEELEGKQRMLGYFRDWLRQLSAMEKKPKQKKDHGV